MKPLLFRMGPLVILLFTAIPSFANPPQADPNHAASEPTKLSQQQTTRSSVVVNPKFDDYVRKRPFVRFTYKNEEHARLLGLADRFMTLKQLDNAITKILSDRP